MTTPAIERLVILIVEDEYLIRTASTDAIRDAGFEVVEAANADNAIAILQSRSDIQVVFTDIHLPGSMDGAKLAHAIKHRWPPVRIIATSGRWKSKRSICRLERYSSPSHTSRSILPGHCTHSLALERGSPCRHVPIRKQSLCGAGSHPSRERIA
jgi:two-component system, response regulator PdtaR